MSITVPLAGALTPYTLTLPVDDGTSGEALITDGSGILSWGTVAPGGAAGGDLNGTYPHPTIAASAVITTAINNDAVTLAKMDALAATNFILGNASGDPAAATMSGDATMGNTGVVTIANDAVSIAKMAGLTSANFILGDGSNDPAAVTMSGDATMDNAGAVTIANDAVSVAKMAGLASANFILGNASGDPAAVTVSGDATMANTGAVTLVNASVTGQAITGYSSGAGTVAGTDTILEAIEKLDGNDALKLPLAGGTMTGDLQMNAQTDLKFGNTA